jgi:hypothetical protein
LEEIDAKRSDGQESSSVGTSSKEEMEASIEEKI